MEALAEIISLFGQREYILKEALSSSRLGEERPALTTTDTVTVAVNGLSRLEKAMILYNHARVASLPVEVREYLRGNACISITDHPNYSPSRSGTYVLVVSKTSRTPPVETRWPSRVGSISFFRCLEMPGRRHILLHHPARSSFVSEITAVGGSIEVSELRRRYENAITGTPGAYHSFDNSIANAVGTFLRLRTYRVGDDLVQFYHPSMRNLLNELIQTDKATRIAYLKQLALKELCAVGAPLRAAESGGSEGHRIIISDVGDIELLRDHIRETLLPAAELSDALSVVTDLHATLTQGKAESLGRHVRESPDYGKVFWMILDSVVPYLCSKNFWQRNSDVA